MRASRPATATTTLLSLILAFCAASAQQAAGQMVTWDAAVVTDATGAFVPALAAGDSGLHVTSLAAFPTGALHYKRSLDDGLTWQDDYVLSESAWVTGRVETDEGLVVVAWTDTVSDREVRAARSLDGGETWEASLPLSAPGAALVCTGLAVSGANVVVVWEEVVGSVSTVYVSVSHDSGGSWGEPLPAATGPEPTAQGEGGVAIAGSSLVVSYAGGAGAYAVYSMDWGETWSSPTTLVSGSGGYSLRDLCSSGANVLTLVFHHPTQEHTIAHSGDGGTTWSTLPVGASSMPGNVALAGGTGFVSWGTSALLEYTVSRDGGQTWPASGTLAIEMGDATSSAVQTPYVYVAEFDPASGAASVQRGSLAAHVSIATPASDQVFPAGTTSTPITVTIDHPLPAGHWHWQLDTQFADTGVAGGSHVDPGVLTDTIADLVDGGAYTVYVALVSDAAHNLIDVNDNADSRASVAFSVDTGIAPATVSIMTPTEGQELPPGTATTTLSVDITGHTAETWAWRLDTAFPDTGAVPGDANPVASGSIAGIGGLVDGASHTVYVALVDGDLVDATAEPASRASAAFSIGILPTEFVRVVSKQGGAGTTTAIPVEIYAVPVGTVTGVDLDLHYDETILTPTSDAGVLAAVTVNAALVPADWVILQNISSPGVLSVSLASAFANALTGGEILSVAFDVAVGAVAGTQTPLTLTGVRLNEDEVDSTGVAGLFTVLNVVYGDVTGDGTISAYDASWVLEWVANDLAGTPIVFPIEENAPMWASLPLTGPEALEVADVDDDGFITAMDASDILRKRVGIIDLFVAEGGAPSAPSSAPGAAVYSLRGLALSERPGAQVTVTLDASAMADLYGGELVLDFDPSLLRPVDVALRRHDARDAMQRPLLTQSEGDGRLAVAFASARPIEASDALLEVTFEATRDISHARESAIRASHLRLNRSKIETDFAFPFRVEPFANRLMANYPNPFNPETWIPFELAADSHVEVRVYGLDGSVVRTVELGRRAIGEYRTRDEAAYWDGRNESGEHVASGVYVYELVAGAHRSVRRMTVLK